MASSDYVQIYDGDGDDHTRLARVRWMPSNPIYHSTGNQMYVVMTTDSSGYSTGFQMTWGKELSPLSTKTDLLHIWYTAYSNILIHCNKRVMVVLITCV